MTAWPRPPRPVAENRPVLEELDEAACWTLLRRLSVARVAVPLPGGDVLVVPVNVAVHGASVLFRTAPGTVTGHLGDRATVQADGFDDASHEGWSVLAHGSVTMAESAPDDGGPEPWPVGHFGVLVRVHVDYVTGRVLHPGPYEWDPRGYL